MLFHFVFDWVINQTVDQSIECRMTATFQIMYLDYAVDSVVIGETPLNLQPTNDQIGVSLKLVINVLNRKVMTTLIGPAQTFRINCYNVEKV